MTLRRFFAAACAGLGLCFVSSPSAMAQDQSLRPFKVRVPQPTLDDLRRRVNATRWPDKETVGDRSQGMHAVLGINLPNYASAIVTTAVTGATFDIDGGQQLT